jgi:hypothetical protein
VAPPLRRASSFARTKTKSLREKVPSVAPIGDQARRGEVELFGRAVEHRLGRADFRLANGRRRLDVHDHRVLQVDEIVVRISITGDFAEAV